MSEVVFDAAMLAEFSDEFSAKLAELNHQFIQAEEAVDQPLILAMFRSAHSLKGLSALVGMRAGAEVAHALEGVLEGVRAGRLRIGEMVLEAAFATCDLLQVLLAEFMAGGAGGSDVTPCLALLQRAAQGGEAAVPAGAEGAEAEVVRAEAGGAGTRKPSHAQEPGIWPAGQPTGDGELTDAQAQHDLGDDDASALEAPLAEPPAAAPAGAAAASPAAAARSHDAHAVELEMLRIDPKRLDLVLNTSGELMVARAQLIDRYRGLFAQLMRCMAEHKAQAMTTAGAALGTQLRTALEMAEALEAPVRTIQRLSSNLQGSAMRLRMVPIGPAFRRFERVLRDACRSTGHEARLLIEGERTELDKKLVDHLIDPLTHLVRNAVDHGIETPAARQAAGKPARGTVRMEARHESGRVVIRVGDDGGGIDHRIVREVLVRKGLMSAEQAGRLSEREAIAKIFESGFSTARSVTDISGRGVGLDIVRNRIMELSGSIEIESMLGAGTTFVIRLPLTLAMVRSLLVRIGEARYALPLHSVREVVAVQPQRLRRVAGSSTHLACRDELIPLVTLRSDHDVDQQEGGWAVLTRDRAGMLAVRVDQVLREEELVVKPVPQVLRGGAGATGAAILGDGSIALFVDIDTLRDRLHADTDARVLR